MKRTIRLVLPLLLMASALTVLAQKPTALRKSLTSLCYLGVLCASVIEELFEKNNDRNTEHR